MDKFKAGDRVKVVSAKMKSYWYSDKVGKTFILDDYCEKHGPVVRINGVSCYFVEDDIIKVPVSPEDEVTITTTYGELAKVYAVMGCVGANTWYGESIFHTITKILDADRTVYDKLIYDKIPQSQRIYYADYQDEWIKSLFGEQESEEDKAKTLKIKELEESINNAKKQLEDLKNLK